MSNCEVVSLPSIEVELHQVREVLRCLAHTIIFNRALGPLKPTEVDSELFDITWVRQERGLGAPSMTGFTAHLDMHTCQVPRAGDVRRPVMNEGGAGSSR